MGRAKSAGIFSVCAAIMSFAVPAWSNEIGSPDKSPAASQSADQASAPPVEKMTLPATTRAAALEEAKAAAGRANPFSAIAPVASFPRGGELLAAKSKKSAAAPIRTNFVPPPPPTAVATPPPGQSEELSVSELPAPPEKQSIASKLKLTAIIGDKAIFTFTDQMFRRQNHYARTLTLASGEQLDALTLVNVAPDSVTLEEDGERVTKALERVR